MLGNPIIGRLRAVQQFQLENIRVELKVKDEGNKGYKRGKTVGKGSALFMKDAPPCLSLKMPVWLGYRKLLGPWYHISMQ